LALTLQGLVSLAESASIEQRLAKLGLQLFHLQTDVASLKTAAVSSDLEALGQGLLASVAQSLKAAAGGKGEDSETAQRALRKLFTLARLAEAEAAP
jgi:hypothetical protein